jgi:hypothetical protein
MEAINLVRVDLITAQGDPWIAAIMADFYVPPGARVFVGRTEEGGDRVVFFIDKTGGGMGYIHRASGRRGSDEYEFDEGTFNYNAREIIQEASMSLF